MYLVLGTISKKYLSTFGQCTLYLSTLKALVDREPGGGGGGQPSWKGKEFIFGHN